MTHKFEAEFNIGDIIEARWSYYGVPYQKAEVKQIRYIVSKDGTEIVYVVKSLQHGNRFNANQHNVRKYEKLG